MKAGAITWLVLGLFGLCVAIVFPILTRNIIQVAAGSTMLGVFALSMLYISWVLHTGRHTDFSDQVEAEAQVGPEHVFPSSWWPAPLALGIAIFALGIKFDLFMVVIGGVIIVITVAGWFYQRDHMVHQHHAGESGPIPATGTLSSYGSEFGERVPRLPDEPRPRSEEIGPEHA